MVGPARRVAAAAAFAVGVATLGPAVFTASADAQDADPPGEVRAQLVRTTDTSKFDKPSPDPSGITYLADRGRLLISDSEVEEMSLYRGANLFYLTRWGRKTWDRSTIRFSAEPTGVTHNPRNRHLFTSDDDADRVYEIAPGSDGAHGTSDDVVTSFSLRKVGSRDAEDVVFDTTRGHLLVVDGVGTEVYRYEPGDNGRFDGSDDKVSHFDVRDIGAKDPEGITYDGVRDSILLLDHKSQKIYEMTSTGVLLFTIDISAARAVNPAGLTLAPASDGSATKHLYIVDRGIDNDFAPRENDGRLYEMAVSLPPRL